MQIVKISTGTAGDEAFLPASVANGLTVDVTRIQGTVSVVNATAANLKVDASGVAVPITDNSASLTVDAPAGTPVAVRLSTGSAFIDTIPVSIAGTVAVSGTTTLSGTVAASQSGTWNVGTVTTITNTVTVTGTVALSGTSPVSGTVTANQGTAAAVGNAWVTKITDGTNPVGVSTVSGAFALKVDVIKQVGGGFSQVDRAAYVDGTTAVEIVGGVFNDSATAPGASQGGYARMTSFRAFHMNLRRNADGVELGVAAAPLRTDPTGATIQPVNGTVTVNQGATAWVTNLTEINGAAAVAAAAGVLQVGIVNGAGVAFSAAAALPVQMTPSGGAGGATRTPWRSHLTISAGQTAIALHTPAGGKTAFVEGYVFTLSAGSGVFQLFDNTNTDANTLWGSAAVWAFLNQVVCPASPIPLSAVGNVLRYTSGTAVVGDITVWGYDA
jgi:hypothetical protein